MREGRFLTGHRVHDWLCLTPLSGLKHRRGLKPSTVPTGTGTGIRQTALMGQHQHDAAVQRWSSDPNDEGCAEGSPIVADCSAAQRGPLTMGRGTMHKSAPRSEEKTKTQTPEWALLGLDYNRSPTALITSCPGGRRRRSTLSALPLVRSAGAANVGPASFGWHAEYAVSPPSLVALMSAVAAYLVY